jgi:hypothetical protein
MSQPPNQPYPGQPYPDQPTSGSPWTGRPEAVQQPWSSPPSSGQPHPGQPHPGQPHPGQPHPGQPHPGQPYPGQAGYPGPGYQGQPNPDVPASVPPQPGFPPQPASVPQPSYPQPEYAQPAYPQPGYPQPGYPPSGTPMPGYPQQGYPAPKKKSRAVPITLVSVALALVLCVGGGTAVYLAGRNTADGIADAIASAGPTTRPTENATTAPAAVITIVEPKTLGGRPKLTDPKFAGTVDQLERNLALLPGASQSFGAIYGTPAKRDVVLVVAAKSFVLDPKDEVDSAFSGSGFGKLNLTGVVSIPAGPLGGAAKCGKGSDEGVQVSLCAWADEGSSGLMIWYFTALSKAKAEFVKLRGQVEKKSN